MEWIAPLLNLNTQTDVACFISGVLCCVVFIKHGKVFWFAELNFLAFLIRTCPGQPGIEPRISWLSFHGNSLKSSSAFIVAWNNSLNSLFWNHVHLAGKTRLVIENIVLFNTTLALGKSSYFRLDRSFSKTLTFFNLHSPDSDLFALVKPINLT